MTRSYNSTGIVLARKNFGEADRILSLFTKDKGRISIMAKGVRRPTSKKRGHIELFNLIGFQGVKSSGMDIMTETEIINDFKLSGESLKKISLAYYFCEVTGRITNEYEPNSAIYDLLLESLKKLMVTSKLKNLRLEFIERILTISGFWPNGKVMKNHDSLLEEALERQIFSHRVGKIISS